MTIPTVTPYAGEIANPDGSQTQTEFTQNMFDQLSFEKTFVPELNNSIAEINNTASQVDTDAVNAAQSANNAQAAADSVAAVQFVRSRIGNISDYTGDTLTESERFNIYQYPDNSDYWYGVKEGENFPVTIPVDPSNDDGWALTTAATTDYVLNSFKTETQKYTDIVYDNVENMIVGTPIAANDGDFISTGETRWKSNGSIGIPIPGGLFAKSNEIHASDYLSNLAPTKSEVLAAIQLAITHCDASGGGDVVVSSDLNYGYNRNDPSTFPDLTSTTNNVSVIDLSIGDTYTLPSRDGNQVRSLMHTPNQGDSLHDGNTEWLRAAWAPARNISNDANLAPPNDPSRSALDNYRASNFFCANGVAKWGIQQGGRSGASFTEDELTQFKVIMNDIPDYNVVGLASAMTIEKSNGWFGFHSNPISYYDFNVRPGGSNAIMSLRASDLNPSLRLTNESTTDRAELAVSANSLEIRSSKGAIYESNQSGSQHTISRKDAGDVSLELKGTDYSRRMAVRSSDGAFRVVNSSNTASTMTHDDSGNLVITGAYSPFTGTHLFFSKHKIDEGCAVDLIDHDAVEFISYTPITETKYNRTEVKEDIAPRFIGEDYESWMDRCTEGKVITEAYEEVVDYSESVTVLNGTISICDNPESKICAGIVERQVEMEGGFLTYVAAVGDNKTENLKGFRVNGDIEAGDILCTDTGGKLKLAPDNISRSVVVFKAMSPVDSNGRCYGYFIG